MKNLSEAEKSANINRKTGFMTSLGQKFRNFGKNSEGAAAIEFAFVVPIMLALYFGTMEVSQGIEVNKKAGRASSLVADLVTQQATISKSELVAIAGIAAATLQPYNRTAPVVEIVGIQISDEPTPKARVAWSHRIKGPAGMSFMTVGSIITIPNELLIRNTFIVRGGLKIDYLPVTTYTIASSAGNGEKGIAMGEEYYLRPRTSPTIPCGDC